MAQAVHGSRPDGKIGLAWNIEVREVPGMRSHTGGTMGFRSYLALDGEKRVGVVVLANTSTEAVMALGYALFQMLRGEPHDLALPRLVILSPEALEQCTGRFELEPDLYLTITLERGALFAQFTEGPKHSIYPSSETTFHYIVDQVRLDFEMGEDGRAKRVVVHATDETVPADRVD